MYKKIMVRIGILLLLLSLCGCIATSTRVKTDEPTQDQGMVINLPERTIADMSKQPAHVKFVLAAMGNKVRGEGHPIPEVNFSPNGEHAFYDPDVTYEDFDLTRIQITGFEVVDQTENEARFIIEGIFSFEDLFRRGSSVYFAADYTVHKNGVTINNSGTALIAPAYPDMEVYYVPVSSFDGVDMTEISSFMDLYLHAVINAYDMRTTEAGRKAKEEFEQLSTWKKMVAKSATMAQDFYIMAFCKDRLPPETSLEMRIKNNAQMQGENLFEVGYVYDQGWRVMIAGGNFSPDSFNSNIYVGFQYEVDPGEIPNTQCVGIYKNQKNYDNTPKFIFEQKSESKITTMPETQPAATTISQPKPTPIASGSVFLNPGKKDDAKLIQTRLAEMGYYTKKIDGDFGTGSKSALQNFKKDNGLDDNVNWDLNTQKMLFKNSGL
jgi:hypothetical protein